MLTIADEEGRAELLNDKGLCRVNLLDQEKRKLAKIEIMATSMEQILNILQGVFLLTNSIQQLSYDEAYP